MKIRLSIKKSSEEVSLWHERHSWQEEIRGTCPVYRAGDSFKLEDGYRLVTDIPLCMHSLASLLPHYNALRISKPARWGLAGKEDKTKKAYVCLDALDYTHGGTAIFEISRSP